MIGKRKILGRKEGNAMSDENKEKWMQRIMGLICLLIIFFIVFDAMKNSNNHTMTEEDKQIEKVLDGQVVTTPEATAE